MLATERNRQLPLQPVADVMQYDLTVAEQVISPDGYLANCTTVNGQFPGPTIEADWGDTIREYPLVNRHLISN